MAATVKVVSLLADAQTLLLDADAGARWPLTELQRWLNAAYLEVVNVKPEASTQSGTFNCVAGVRQNLTTTFSGATRLLEVVRNVAVGSTGQAVIQVERHSLDDQRRTWPSDPASITIENYIFDPRLPTEFMVYPPALNTAQLEVIYHSTPAPHTLTLSQLQNQSTTEVIRIPDAYANALREYVLYLAFSKDSDVPANAERAAAHYQAFKDSLSGKLAGDDATQPGSA